MEKQRGRIVQDVYGRLSNNGYPVWVKDMLYKYGNLYSEEWNKVQKNQVPNPNQINLNKVPKDNLNKVSKDLSNIQQQALVYLVPTVCKLINATAWTTKLVCDKANQELCNYLHNSCKDFGENFISVRNKIQETV